MKGSTVSIATPRSKAVQTRRSRELSQDSGKAKTAVDPRQSPGKRVPKALLRSKRRVLSGRRRSKGRRTTVADAAFWLFCRTSSIELQLPRGFELRLREQGERIVGGVWHVPSGKFVASWFYILATTRLEWVIAFMPATCTRIDAQLVPFADVERLPSFLRKAGCRVGNAPLLVQMMREFVPRSVE